jgi:hypothetical protein
VRQTRKDVTQNKLNLGNPVIIGWIGLGDDKFINCLGDGLGWLFLRSIKKALELGGTYAGIIWACQRR